VHINALETFKRPSESPFYFSKAIRQPFHHKEIAREFQFLYQPIDKKELKSCEGIQNKFNQQVEINQRADTHTGLEKSISIQKHIGYPAKEFKN